VRNQAIEDPFDVAGDVGVGVFVDGGAGGGVRNIDVADANLHIRFADPARLRGLYLQTAGGDSF